MDIDRRWLLSLFAITGALCPRSLLMSESQGAEPDIYALWTGTDSTIVTSAGLIQLDSGLCANMSLKACVSELEKRIGHALSQSKVRNQFANTKSQCFALSSITLKRMRDCLTTDLLNHLERQKDFVVANFGLLAFDSLPINVAIVISEDQVVSAWDAIIYIAGKTGFRRPNISEFDLYCLAIAPTFQNDARSTAVIHLITFWPICTAFVRLEAPHARPLVN